ncbi:MAG: hypothetical protein WAO20_17875, partial [Acidobacteriota bacterium]
MRSWHGLVWVGVVVCGSTLVLGQAARTTRRKAWDALVEKNPAVVEDPSIGWRERLILNVLTADQAEAYFQDGAKAESLLLENGQTLKEYLDAKLSPAAAGYASLPVPCPLFEMEALNPDQGYPLFARGEDLSVQGGSVSGCSIPEGATALVLRLRISSGGPSIRLKLWPSDGPEPSEGLLEMETANPEDRETTAVVTLCRDNCNRGDLTLAQRGVRKVQGQVVGYFEPLAQVGAPLGGVSLYTEDSGNNYFGTGAGGGGGTYDSFFGAYSGDVNTGSYNSFFGRSSGANNSSADNNSFFGSEAGYFNTTGADNSFFGSLAGYANQTGYSNVFVGRSAGTANTTGYSNSFFGRDAGFSNTTGSENTFVGRASGYSSSTGDSNVFVGHFSGFDNTAGNDNAFLGHKAGESNTSGYANTFVGSAAGDANTTGWENTFLGFHAGYSNISAIQNTFVGYEAGHLNTTGSDNAFFGYQAGRSATTADENSFFGDQAGFSNTAGSANASFGTIAGFSNTTGDGNAFFGVGAGMSNTVENVNTFLGAWTNGSEGVSNATAIGYSAQVSQSNSLVLGSINGVNGAASDVKVGIGTTAPEEALHVARSDGTAMIKVEETSAATANRVLFRLTNNGAPWFKLLNSNTGQEWTFAMDQF